MKDMHLQFKEMLGFKKNDSSKKILSFWNSKVKMHCKPCWELKYCPYGPLVEGFPLPPVTLEVAKDHYNYKVGCIKSGKLGDGRKLEGQLRKAFVEEIKKFDESDYPDRTPQLVEDISCGVFGHVCPVYYVAEPATETREQRKYTRSISRDVMLKVVRRDSQTCQKCFEIVKDNEVEFDHVIPFSRGGTSTVDNLRLVHRTCNRKKSNKTDDFLHEDPVGNFWVAMHKLKKRRKTK